jgi:tetratricopeptide (TPR) repeat protein
MRISVKTPRIIAKITLVLALALICGSPAFLYAQDTAVLLERAKTAIGKNDFAAALADLNQIVGKEPSNAEAFTQRARVYFFQQKDDLALSDAEKALNLNPTNTAALNVRGLVKYNKKDYTGAIADYSQAIAVDSKYVRAYGNRLRANIKIGAAEELIVGDYLKAKELDPNFSAIYQSIGVWCLQTRKYNCRKDFENLIRLEPNNEFGYFGRGTERLAGLERNATNPGRENLNKIIIDDVTSALDDFDKAIQMNPKTSDSYNNRGRLKYILGDYDQAIADFDKAASLDPKNFQALMNRGTANRAKKNYDAALKDYAEAEKLEPKAALLMFEKSLLYREIGEIDSAMASVNQALYIEPKNSDYVILQAILLIDKNRHEEALEKFTGIYKNGLSDNGGFRWLGTCFESAPKGDAYLKIQNYIDAETSFRSALQWSKGDCRERALFGYASVTLLQKRPDLAMEKLAELDKLNPKYPGLKEKQKEVAAAMPAYNQQQAEWKAQWEAKQAEWERQVQAQLARESSSNQRKRPAKAVNSQLVGEAVEAYDALVSRLEALDETYGSAAAKLRRAAASDSKNGVNSVQFYKGTMNRAQSAMDEAHRIIREFLNKYDSVLDDDSKRKLEDWDDSFPTSIFY